MKFGIKALVAMNVAVMGVSEAQTIEVASGVFFVGEAVQVEWKGGGGLEDWIALNPRGVAPGEFKALQWCYLNGSHILPERLGKSGLVKFSGVRPGEYDLYLLGDGAYGIVDGPVVVRVAEKTQVKVSVEVKKAGVEVWFENAEAGLNDWVGIYARGQVPGKGRPALHWSYTNGTQLANGVRRSAGSLSFPDLIKDGAYVAYHFTGEGYGLISKPVGFSIGGEVERSEEVEKGGRAAGRASLISVGGISISLTRG
ncbi:hypothetical protein [Rubritalea tangerina]|uniref:Uncharacterized protein n=1 Tax=Rubritalea tangerina TaxID=430798 RepID=A0ABW4ZCW3_9BACT